MKTLVLTEEEFRAMYPLSEDVVELLEKFIDGTMTVDDRVVLGSFIRLEVCAAAPLRMD